MGRRLLLAPAVVGVIAAVEVCRRGAWLAWPILSNLRAVCRRAQPTDNTELDYLA